MRRVITCAVLAVLAGCRFDASGYETGGDDGDLIDPARPDAATPAPDPDAAPVDPPDAEPRPDPCEAACDEGTCVEGTCVITCDDNECNGNVQCPPGFPCHVTCGAKACGGIDCREATACTIECVGNDSCSNRIRCGDGPCDVTCTGNKSCKGAVECADSCACDVVCDGQNSCAGGWSCPSDCDIEGDVVACSSAPEDCDSCSP